MYHHVDEVEWHLTAHPIHGEWNVRELREAILASGQRLVSWVFRDDGPMRNRMRRHADIQLVYTLPAHVDWPGSDVPLAVPGERESALTRIGTPVSAATPEGGRYFATFWPCHKSFILNKTLGIV